MYGYGTLFFLFRKTRGVLHMYKFQVSFNRLDDCCPQHLQHVDVHVGDNPTTSVLNPDNPICGSVGPYNSTFYPQKNYVVECQRPLAGKYLTISKSNAIEEGPLSIVELYIQQLKDVEKGTDLEGIKAIKNNLIKVNYFFSFSFALFSIPN